MARRPTKAWERVIGLSVSAGLLLLITTSIGLDGLREAFDDAESWLVLTALVVSLVFVFFQGAVVTRSALSLFGHTLPYRSILLVTVANMAFKFPLPASMAELVKPLYLQRRFSVPLERGLASSLLVMVGRILSLSVIAGVAALFVAGDFTVAIPTFGVSALTVVVLFAVSASKKYRDSTQRDAGALSMLKSVPFELLRVFELRPNKLRALVSFFFHVGCVYLGELLIFVILLEAFGLTVPLGLTVSMLPLCVLIGRLPVTFQGVGAREGAFVLLFAGAATPDQLLAVSLAFSLVRHVVPSFIGLLFAYGYVRDIVKGSQGNASSRQD